MQAGVNTMDPPKQDLTLLAHDPRAEAVGLDVNRFRVFRRPNPRVARSARNIFVIVPATDLPDVSEFVSTANRRHQLRALLVRDDVKPSSIPQMFERAGLRMMRNTVVHSDPGVPRRVLAAWAQNAQDQLIAKASVSEDRLFVVSCALQPYEIPFDRMPALKRIHSAERANFTVDEDGSYIHWPGPDIHIDLDAIRATIDPEAAARAAVAKAVHDKGYGAAIAKLRRARVLKQSDIEGLSERQVRRIEKGEGTTYDALCRLAESHRMSVEKYLQAVAANVAGRTPKRASGP